MVNNSSKIRKMLLELKLEDMFTSLSNFQRIFDKSLDRYHRLFSLLEPTLPVYQLQLIEDVYQQMFSKFLHRFDHVKYRKYPYIIDPLRDTKVVNWSNFTLTEEQKDFLSLGPNFRIRPNSKAFIKDAIAEVESHLKNNRSSQDRDSIITTISRNILDSISTGISNLTPSERKGLTTLKLLKDPPRFLPADKGGGLVCVDSETYNTAIKDELRASSYLKLDKSPLRSMKNLRTRWFNNFKIPFTPPTSSSESLPILKLLPKTHKEDMKWRPLISSSFSPMREVERVVKPLLKSVVKFRSISHRELISRLKHLTLHRDREYILSNLDVVSMFPSLNRDNLFSYLEDFLTSSVLTRSQVDLVISGVKLCLDQDCVCWEDTHFKIVQGLGIGSTLSSYLAEIYIQHWEDEGPLKLPLTKSLVSWVRYVDDIFLLWEGDITSLEDFVSQLNNIDPSLQLKYSFDHLSLPFLDVRVTLHRHVFRFSWFRKRGYAGNFLHNRSDVSPISKRLSVHNQVKRIIDLNDGHSYMYDINFFFSILIHRGYSISYLRKILQKVTKKSLSVNNISQDNSDKTDWKRCLKLPALLYSRNNISTPIVYTSGKKLISRVSFQHNNDIDPLSQEGVVYSVPCSACDSIYIGETGRLLSLRINEHRRALKSEDVQHNAIANHAWSEQHRPNFEATSIISREKSLLKRKYKEHIEIITSQNTLMNNNLGTEINHLWDFVLSLLGLTNTHQQC